MSESNAFSADPPEPTGAAAAPALTRRRRVLLHVWVGGVTLAGLLAALWLLRDAGAVDWGDPVLWLLSAAVVLGWFVPFLSHRLDITTLVFPVPFQLALLVMVGPVPAGLVDTAGVIATELSRRRDPMRLMFNLAVAWLTVALAYGAFRLTAGEAAAFTPAWAGGVLAAGIMLQLPNNWFVLVAQGLSRALPLSRWISRSDLTRELSSVVLLTAIAPAVVAVAKAAPWLVLPMVVPALLVDVFYRHLADRAHRARLDLPTGLPNRHGFLEELCDLEQRGVAPTQLARVRLTGVTEIAEHLGVDGSTTASASSAERLLREPPVHLVGRISDEDLAVAGDDRLAEALTAALSEATVATSVPVPGTFAAGTAPLEDPRAGAAALDSATAALRAALRSGLQVVAFDRETEQRRMEQVTLLAQLPDAIDRGEIIAWFQPKVRLIDGVPVGIEALVRWRHPQLGLLSPARFVPIAERTATADRLTDAVIAQALAHARAIADQGRPLPVAVNVAPATVRNPAFPDRVAAALRDAGLPADRLELEITESAAIEHLPSTMAVLERLNELGVRLTLDDFGVGHASMAHLASLPVRSIKLDKCFAQRLDAATRADLAVVHATVRLAAEMGLTLVAEGVETDTARQELLRAGCRFAQGYHFARPMPADQLVRWLADAGDLPRPAGLRASPRT